MPALTVLFPAGAVATLQSQLTQIPQVWFTIPQKNYTVCNLPTDDGGSTCLTRYPGPELLANNETLSQATPFGCITKQGWVRPILWPPPNPAQACPGSPNLTYVNTTFSAPEHLTMIYSTLQNLIQAQPNATREARRILTSVNAAADSIWQAAQVAYGVTIYFRNVTRADLPTVRAKYGAEWQSLWTTLANQGNLMELNYTYMEGITSEEQQGRWTVATHVILRYQTLNGKVNPRALAIRLSNVGGNPTAFEVYTPRKSASAFILAAMLARSVVYATVGHIGHYYMQHIVSSAAQYALYNTIDPGVPMYNSTHPVRQVIDLYAAPILQSQWASMYFSAAVLPTTPTSIAFENNNLLLALLNRFATTGPHPGPNTFHSTQPAQLLVRSGLHVDKFTSPGGQPWDQYPQARFALELQAIVDTFATRFIDANYRTDAAVAGDAKIQAWAAAMIDPLGGNLGRITPSNNIRTKRDLTQVVGHMLGLTVFHQILNFFDFTVGKWSMANLPFSPAIMELPSPNATYSLDEIVGAGVDAVAYAKQINFDSYMDLVTPPSPYQWVPYQCPGGVCPPQYDRSAKPDYYGKLPFSNSTAAGLAMNEAVIAFRKDVPKFLATTEYTRVLHTVTDPDLMAVLFFQYIHN